MGLYFFNFSLHLSSCRPDGLKYQKGKPKDNIITYRHLGIYLAEIGS